MSILGCAVLIMASGTSAEPRPYFQQEPLLADGLEVTDQVAVFLAAGNHVMAKRAIESALWPEDGSMLSWTRMRRDLAIYLYLCEDTQDLAGIDRALTKTRELAKQWYDRPENTDGMFATGFPPDNESWKAVAYIMGSGNCSSENLWEVVWSPLLAEAAVEKAPHMDEAWLRLAACYVGRPRFDAVRAHVAFKKISPLGELAKGAPYRDMGDSVKYFWDMHNLRPWAFLAGDAWLILKLSLRERHGRMLDKNHGDDSYLISLLDIVNNPGERLVAMPAKLERIGGHDPLSQAIAGIGYLRTEQPEKARPYLKRVIEMGGTGFAELDSMLPRLLDVAPVLPRP